VSEIIGICFLAAGAATLFATWIEYRRQHRHSGITPELAELLRTPTYVLRAKAYCRAYGYPESDWKRFQDLAFADVLARGMA
jgi:hypothetical protein